MSFLIYGAVILVAAASAMFGLDLLTAPLPQKPATQIESKATPPSRLEQHVASRKQQAADAAKADDRALTPVFPVAPGGSKEVRMVYPPLNETTGAGSSDDKRPAPARQPEQTAQAPQAPSQPEPTKQAEAVTAPKATSEASVAPKAAAPIEPPKVTAAVEPPPANRLPPPPASEANNAAPAATAQAKAERPAMETAEKANTPPAAIPVTQQSSNRCDVSACAAKYSSFRASDCTYQPYGGARRVCEKAPDGERQRSASRDNGLRSMASEPRSERSSRQARREVDLDAVERRVKQMTTARGDFEDDDLDDEPVRRRVIVIEREQRGFERGFLSFGGWR